MTFQEALDLLNDEMDAKKRQIKQFFKTQKMEKVFRGINLELATFEITEEADPESLLDSCEGAIPLRMFRIEVTEGKKKKITVIVYTCKHTKNGKEKVSVAMSSIEIKITAGYICSRYLKVYEKWLNYAGSDSMLD